MKKRLYVYTFLFLILSVAAISIVFPNKFYKDDIRVSNVSVSTEIKNKLISFPNLLRFNNSLILTVDEVVAWTNNERLTHSIPVLEPNETLNQIAGLRLKDMAQNQYFAHNSPGNGRGASEEAEVLNYKFLTIGENIALGSFRDDKSLVDAWMNSPAHRDNILSDKYTQLGIAVEKINFEGRDTWLAVQIFARPSSDCPLPDSSQKIIIENERVRLNELVLRADLLLKEMTATKNSGNATLYNQKVPIYNSLVKEINQKSTNLTKSIVQYNNKVNAFNFCLSK